MQAHSQTQHHDLIINQPPFTKTSPSNPNNGKPATRLKTSGHHDSALIIQTRTTKLAFQRHSVPGGHGGSIIVNSKSSAMSRSGAVKEGVTNPRAALLIGGETGSRSDFLIFHLLSSKLRFSRLDTNSPKAKACFFLFVSDFHSTYSGCFSPLVPPFIFLRPPSEI